MPALARFAGCAVLAFVAITLARIISYGAPQEFLIWPAAALALALAWRFDWSAVPAVGVGTALAIGVFYRSVPLASLSFVVACVGPSFGLLVLRRLDEWKPGVSHLESMLRFFTVSLLVIAPCSAMLASISRLWLDPAQQATLPALWLHWWLIESLGLCVLGPALLVALDIPLEEHLGGDQEEISDSNPIDSSSILLSLVLLALLLILYTGNLGHWAQSTSFLLLPICAWLAIRHAGNTAALTLPILVLPLIAAQAYGHRVAVETLTRNNNTAFDLNFIWLVAALLTGLLYSIANDRRLAIMRMSKHAREDLSTGLLNDRGLLAEFGDHLAASTRAHYGIIGVQLSNFDRLSDLCGTITALQLERSTASLLTGQPGILTAARLASGRYTLLIKAETVAEVRSVSRELYSQLNGQLFKTENGSLRLQAAIAGLLVDRATRISSEDCLSALKDAMTIAASVRDPQLFVEPLSQTMIDARRAHQEKVEHIREAVREARIELYAQPILDPHAGRRFSYEVLSRLRDAKGKLIQPPEFMPLATQAQMTTTLDRAVILKVFAWLAEHPSALESTYKCSINLSGLTLSDPSISGYVRQQKSNFSIPAEKIVFEITESEAIRNPAAASRLVDELKEQGFGIALDDFGTGLATFEYLKRFPLDYLKIDGQFIRNLENNPIDEEIVLATIRVARRLNVKTIAEHVHSAEIMALLRELGVDHMQGYYIGEPQPIAHIFAHANASSVAAV